MVEKSVAVEILTYIYQTIAKGDNDRALKDIDIYTKNLEITLDSKVLELLEKYNEHVAKYGENRQKNY